MSPGCVSNGRAHGKRDRGADDRGERRRRPRWHGIGRRTNVHSQAGGCIRSGAFTATAFTSAAKHASRLRGLGRRLERRVPQRHFHRRMGGLSSPNGSTEFQHGRCPSVARRRVRGTTDVRQPSSLHRHEFVGPACAGSCRCPRFPPGFRGNRASSATRPRPPRQASLVSRALLAALSRRHIVGRVRLQVPPRAGTGAARDHELGPFSSARRHRAHGAASARASDAAVTGDSRRWTAGACATEHSSRSSSDSCRSTFDRLRLAANANIATLHSLGLGNRTELSAAVPLVLLRVAAHGSEQYWGQVFTQAESATRRSRC